MRRVADADAADGRRAALRAAALALCQPALPCQPTRCAPSRSSLDAWVPAAWERETDSDEVFWLQCRYSSDTRALAAVLEAVEILALVARADLRLWKELTREIWESEPGWWADFVATRTAVSVGVDVLMDEATTADGVGLACEAVVTWMKAPRSPRYVEARSVLKAMATATGTAIPVMPIRICLDGFEGAAFTSILWDIHTVLTRQAPMDQARTTARITQLRTGPLFFALDAKAITTLVSLRSHGIQVSDLALPHNFKDPQTLQYVGSLLDAAPSPSDTSTGTLRYPARDSRARQHREEPPGVESIHVPSFISEAHIPSLFSAIHASRSLRTFSIEIETVHQTSQRTRLFQWMAYGVFCREPLDVLTISECHRLQVEDVQVIRRIITAPNPLAELSSDETVPPPPYDILTREALLEHPSETTSSRCWKSPSPCALHVIGRDGYSPVLLPGWGKAWVHETQTGPILTPSPAVESSIAFHSPTRLILETSETITTPAILELVGLIGGSLKGVSLGENSCSETPVDALCAEILVTCPELEDLSLHDVDLYSVQFILDAFVAHQCPSLKRLSLSPVYVSSLREVDSLFQVLADPTLPISMQLRELELRLHTQDSIRTETLDLLERMLERNSLLRLVQFEIHSGRQLETSVPSFSRFDGETILGDSLPLPRLCVLAFLSVVTNGRCKRTEHCEALKQLDNFVLHLMLGFAGECRTRSVEVLVA